MESSPFNNNLSIKNYKFSSISLELLQKHSSIHNPTFPNHHLFTPNTFIYLNLHNVLQDSNYIQYIEYLLKLKTFSFKEGYFIEDEEDQILFENAFYLNILMISLNLLHQINDTTSHNKENNTKIFNKIISLCFTLCANKIISYECVINISKVLISTVLDHFLQEYKENNLSLHVQLYRYINTLIEAIFVCNTYPFDSLFICDIIKLFIDNLFSVFEIKNHLHYNEKFLLLMNIRFTIDLYTEEAQNLLFEFLCQIYQYNLKGMIYHKILYKHSFQNINFLTNSITLINRLIKHENPINNKDIMIKRGFVVSNNNPLINDNIMFNKKTFPDSYIFIFRFLIKTIPDKSKPIKILTFKSTYKSKEKIMLELYINAESKTLKILYNENQSNDIKYFVNKNCYYTFCFEIKGNKKCKLWTIKFPEQEYLLEELSKFSMVIPDGPMTLELGKDNFNGIFGDILMIKTNNSESFFSKNKAGFNIKDVTALNNDYYLLSDNNVSYSLLNEMKYNINNQKSPEYFTTFRSLREHPNECLYCLSVDSINTNEINKNNYISYNINKESKVYRGIKNTAIEIFDYKLTCFEFLSNNGIDFLIFALFQINMPQLNLTKHETSDFILTCLQLFKNIIEQLKVHALIREENKLKVFFFEFVNFIKTQKNSHIFTEEIIDTLLAIINDFMRFESLQNIDSPISESSLFLPQLGKYLIENCLCLNYFSEKNTDNSVKSILTTINSSISFFPKLLQNKRILKQILSFDSVIEYSSDDHKKLFTSLLKNCLNNNNEMIELFLGFLIENKENFKEEKDYFYLQFTFLYILSNEKSNDIPKMIDFLNEYVIYKFDLTEHEHCRKCDLILSYSYLIIKHFSYYHKNISSIKSSLVDLAKKTENFQIPSITLFKSILASVLHLCPHSQKSKFIENENLEPETIVINGITTLQYGKEMFAILQLSEQFLTTKHNRNEEHLLINEFYHINKYIEFINEPNNQTYNKDLGNTLITMYRDFFLNAFHGNIQSDGKNVNESFYLNIFEKSASSFFLFYFKYNFKEAFAFTETIIEDCILNLSSEVFYYKLIQNPKNTSLDDINLLFSILIDTIVNIHTKNEYILNKNEVINTVYILKNLYIFINNKTIMEQLSGKLFMFQIIMNPFSPSKHLFTVDGVTNPISIAEMLIDLAFVLFAVSPNQQSKYKFILKKILMLEGSNSNASESMFYQIEKKPFDKKIPIAKTKSKKGESTSNAPTPVETESKLQQEKIQCLDQIGFKCNSCFTVYFLGKLLYIKDNYVNVYLTDESFNTENSDTKIYNMDFLDEIIEPYINDILKLKKINKKFAEHFSTNDFESGCFNDIYLMFMNYFKDTCDEEIYKENILDYYENVIVKSIQTKKNEPPKRKEINNNIQEKDIELICLNSNEFNNDTDDNNYKRENKESLEHSNKSKNYKRSKVRMGTTVMGRSVLLDLAKIRSHEITNLNDDERNDRDSHLIFGLGSDSNNESIDERNEDLYRRNQNSQRKRSHSLILKISRNLSNKYLEGVRDSYNYLYDASVDSDLSNQERKRDNNSHNGNENNFATRKMFSNCELLNEDNELERENNINDNEGNLYSRNEFNVNEHLYGDNNSINDDDNKREEQDMIDDTTTQRTKQTFHIFDTDDHIDLNNNINDNDTSSNYYSILFANSEQNLTEMLFNPKQYFIWKTFSYLFRNYLFHNQTFIQLKYKYNKLFKKNLATDTTKYNFELNYPSKLCNFITDEYTKPFIKPNLSFYNHPNFTVSHKYMDKVNPLQNTLLSIPFKRLLPNVSSPKKTFPCELVTNQGYYYGELEINDYIILFQSNSVDDVNLFPIEKKMEYIYASQSFDRIKNHNKNVLIYLNEINEVFQRRFALMWIGFELFLKDKRAFLFNFYSQEKYNQFIEEINTINNKRKLNIFVVTDSKEQFKSNQYKTKYIKETISNYNYLLYVNKYTGRSYNDVLQYPIMPWMLVSIGDKRERNLSKLMVLQKLTHYQQLLQLNDEYENAQNDPNSNNNNITTNSYSNKKVILTPKQKKEMNDFIDSLVFKLENNFESLGYHCNLHYSTNGALYFYNARLSPFTNALIKFQSGVFDAPARMFFSIKELFNTFETSEENREAIPEFFHNYHFLINLNKNDFGFLKENKIQISDVSCETFQNPIDFIITQRNNLDKSTKINEWIDIIFGINQFNAQTYNTFSRTLYATFTHYPTTVKDMKNTGKTDEQIFNAIREEISLLSLGIVPFRLFKKVHPCYQRLSMQPSNSKTDINDIITTSTGITFNRNDFEYGKIHKAIQKDVEWFDIKYSELSLYLQTRNKLSIYEIDPKGKKVHLKHEIPFIEQEEFEPKYCSYCLLSSKLFVFVRYSDNTFKLYIKHKKNQHYLRSYKWMCFISAITSNDNETAYIGDEYGDVSEIYFDMKDIDKVKANLIQKVHCHDSLIIGIQHCKRLNVVVSFDIEGVISIRNEHSLSLINIIEPCKGIKGKKLCDVKISRKDLIYVQFMHEVFVYTLGGIMVSKYECCINSGVTIKAIEITYDDNLFITEDKVVKTVNTWDVNEVLWEEKYDRQIERVYVLKNIKEKWVILQSGKTLNIKYE